LSNSDGWIYLKNDATGLYLDGSDYNVFSRSLSFSDNQKWRIIGSYIMHKSGKVIESDRNGIVYLKPFQGGFYQIWVQFF
jgi:hypothetical protein